MFNKYLVLLICTLFLVLPVMSCSDSDDAEEDVDAGFDGGLGEWDAGSDTDTDMDTDTDSDMDTDTDTDVDTDTDTDTDTDADADADAGEVDAGEEDAGELDAGEVDAAIVDAGSMMACVTRVTVGKVKARMNGICYNSASFCMVGTSPTDPQGSCRTEGEVCCIYDDQCDAQNKLQCEITSCDGGVQTGCANGGYCCVAPK